MQRIKSFFHKGYVLARAGVAAVVLGLIETFGSPRGRRLLAAGALIGGVVLLALRPPMQSVAAGEVGVRINRLTGGITVVPEGPALLWQFGHDLRLYSM